MEGWQAKPDAVVAACLYKCSAGPFPSFGGVAGAIEPPLVAVAQVVSRYAKTQHMLQNVRPLSGVVAACLH